eukprot:02652.XXX_25711_25860_1 [CDS] Oithona nana genome sequencing.
MDFVLANQHSILLHHKRRKNQGSGIKGKLLTNLSKSLHCLKLNFKSIQVK